MQHLLHLKWPMIHAQLDMMDAEGFQMVSVESPLEDAITRLMRVFLERSIWSRGGNIHAIQL